MKVTKFTYKSTNKFSKLVIDYINHDEKLKPFISYFPSIENIQKQIFLKNENFTSRSILVNSLRTQNLNIKKSSLTINNIENLLNDNVYTVTTGHQLCLFTGPMYVIYKIFSTINLVEKLQKEYPKYDFVPIFWMASEDHDFDEVSHFHFFKNKIQWENELNGMVGDMKIENITQIINDLSNVLGNSKNAAKLLLMFKKAYSENNLASATRYLINEMFGKYGLVILDGNDENLKSQFTPIIKKDLVDCGFYNAINVCSEQLSKHYKLQAKVREKNFFRLSKNNRVRIDDFVDESEIINDPSSFSPNVFLRPLYQEKILPNVAYVGGGAEIAYWMQLKLAFKQEDIPMPILFLRNSLTLLDSKKTKRITSLGFSISDIFLGEDKLKNKFIKFQKKSNITFSDEIIKLNKIYDEILLKIKDNSIKDSVLSNQQFQYKFYKKIENKILKFEKNNYKVFLNQISKLHEDLFPFGVLQERFYNFSTFYFYIGEDILKILKNNIDPLDCNFVVLSTKVDDNAK